MPWRRRPHKLQLQSVVLWEAPAPTFGASCGAPHVLPCRTGEKLAPRPCRVNFHNAPLPQHPPPDVLTSVFPVLLHEGRLTCSHYGQVRTLWSDFQVPSDGESCMAVQAKTHKLEKEYERSEQLANSKGQG